MPVGRGKRESMRISSLWLSSVGRTSNRLYFAVSASNCQTPNASSRSCAAVIILDNTALTWLLWTGPRLSLLKSKISSRRCGNSPDLRQDGWPCSTSLSTISALKSGVSMIKPPRATRFWRKSETHSKSSRSSCYHGAKTRIQLAVHSIVLWPVYLLNLREHS
ncbi:hypothetical protein C8R44DRAFT_859352, partial [Mycena epipterygia]